jgi:hypothetical protein
LRLRSGLFSTDTLVHAEQFLGLNGEGSITAPAARGQTALRPDLGGFWLLNNHAIACAR